MIRERNPGRRRSTPREPRRWRHERTARVAQGGTQHHDRADRDRTGARRESVGCAGANRRPGPAYRLRAAQRPLCRDRSCPEVSAEDLDAQSPAADLVRVYLNGIGKTALLTAAQEVDLAKRIEAGVFAQHVLDTAGGRRHRAGPAARRRPARRGAGRDARPQPPAGGQPAAGGVAGQALHRPRHAAARPDPGRQPGPDPRGGEVRLHQGLQVLHLRDLVDPPGHHPRHGRPGPHHPAPGAPGGAGEQAGPDQAGPAPEARPRRDPRGAGRRVRDRPGEGGRPARPRPGPGEPGHAGGLRGGGPARRLHRGRRGHRRGDRGDLAPAARRPAPGAGHPGGPRAARDPDALRPRRRAAVHAGPDRSPVRAVPGAGPADRARGHGASCGSASGPTGCAPTPADAEHRHDGLGRVNRSSPRAVP